MKQLVLRSRGSKGAPLQKLAFSTTHQFKLENSLPLFGEALASYFERRSHGAAPLTLNQTCARPPSTNTSLPVIKLLSSEARNNATAAVSAGFPTRSSAA